MEKEQNANDNAEMAEILEFPQDLNLEEKSLSPEQEEIASLNERLLRQAAEFDNFRKRSEKQVEEAAKYAISGLVKDFTNVAENFYRIMTNIDRQEIENSKALKIVSDGLDLTTRELNNMFERYGIKRINPAIGEEFDHNLHQAVMHVDSEEHQPNTIIQILQAGYMIKDRLINPAMVGVVKG
jgi:molecular chaperone GrpE